MPRWNSHELQCQIHKEMENSQEVQCQNRLNGIMMEYSQRNGNFTRDSMTNYHPMEMLSMVRGNTKYTKVNYVT